MHFNRLRLPLLTLLSLTAFNPMVFASHDGDTNFNSSYCSTYQDYTLARYNEQEAQFLTWERKYQVAPRSSYEEGVADQQRRYYGENAIALLSARDALAYYSRVELESFAERVNQSYRSAPSNTYLENFYYRSMNLAWAAYSFRAQTDMQCRTDYQWEQTVRDAESAYEKYRQAPSNTRKEQAHRDVSNAGWSTALSQLDRYYSSRSYENFRTFEYDGDRFYQAYRVAPSNTSKEQFYLNATRSAYHAAESAFRSQVYSLDSNTLLNLESEYNNRYRQAPSNSLQESYFRNIRDEARNELNSRRNPYPPAPPAPPVPPRPYPPAPPRYDNYTCTVTTRSGQYHGFGQSEGQATAGARNECIKYENSRTCLAGSVVCRRS